MRLISIDPGYDKVGYAIFDKNPDKKTQFTYITSDLIKTSKADLHEKRLKTIYDALNKVIKRHNVEHMVIEELFFSKNQKTVMKVAQAIGVINLVAANNSLPIKYFTPLEIKSIVTGYGSADKVAVQKMVRITLQQELTFKDDDQADAVACGLAFCFINEKLM
ncbi:crossover junction endodeoxyribonuclease RuvC [soil metagenome]